MNDNEVWNLGEFNVSYHVAREIRPFIIDKYSLTRHRGDPKIARESWACNKINSDNAMSEYMCSPALWSPKNQFNSYA